VLLAGLVLMDAGIFLVVGVRPLRRALRHVHGVTASVRDWP
jgi:hypothetical protein